MKKILALLLVVLMLGSVTAFADNATIYTLSDPVLELNFGEEPMQIDLAGLSFAVAPVAVGDEEVIAFNVRGDGATLLVAAFRLDGDRVLIDVDGLSHTYSAEMPAVDVSSTEFNPEDLGIDVEALIATVMSEVSFEQEGDTMRFTVPYTVVNDVLEQLLPAVGQVTELPEGVSLDEVADTVAQLKESDSGVTVTGSYTETETGMFADLQLFLVEAGETSADAIATVNLVLDDVFSFDIVVPDVASIHVGFDPESGKVELKADADGQGFSFCAVVGAEEGEIQVAELGDAASAVDVMSLTDEDTEALTSEAMVAMDDLLTYLMPVLESIM